MPVRFERSQADASQAFVFDRRRSVLYEERMDGLDSAVGPLGGDRSMPACASPSCSCLCSSCVTRAMLVASADGHGLV
jgi:hypothetical protein